MDGSNGKVEDPVNGKTTLKHVSQWPPVNITFEDLFYTINERKGEFFQTLE